MIMEILLSLLVGVIIGVLCTYIPLRKQEKVIYRLDNQIDYCFHVLEDMKNKVDNIDKALDKKKKN